MSPLPSHASCVVLLPDAVESDAVPAIGRWMSAHEVFPLLARPARLSADDFRPIYGRVPRSKTSERGRLYGRLMTESLFESGQSIVVVLTGPPQLSEFLNERKGVSSYRQRSGGGHLRGLSLNSDRGLSLVHAPDTQAEAQMLVDRFWESLPDDWASRSPLIWEDIAKLRSLRSFSCRDARYRGIILLLLRLHMAALLNHRGNSAPDLGMIRDNIGLLEAWLGGEPSGHHIEEVARLGGLLKKLRTPDGPSTLDIGPFLDYREYTYDTGKDVIEIAHRHGLALGRLEEQDILTAFAFFEEN